MCLGIPGKVVEVKDRTAIVDFGGVLREVDATLEEVSPGDYVIVHVGVIISKMDPETARETIEAWEEMIKTLEGSQ